MQGFRHDVLAFLKGIGLFIFWIIVLIILAVLTGLEFIPEAVIAFVIALFTDKWRMWINPYLRKAVIHVYNK